MKKTTTPTPNLQNNKNNNNKHDPTDPLNHNPPFPEEGAEGVALPSRPLVRAIVSSMLSALRHPHAHHHMLVVCCMLQVPQSNRPVKYELAQANFCLDQSNN